MKLETITVNGKVYGKTPRSGEGAVHIRTARKDHGECHKACGIVIYKGRKYVEDRTSCWADQQPGRRLCLDCAENERLITSQQRLAATEPEQGG